ncbi:hypothetical protein [Curtobacterium sp. 18060]|uniref:hypothetical protein n=1 Tax=Curtobacterium sp. 18060 TaxID=2681408 RepID=UPI00135C36FD|nr:hypothetical protein [Curtobacterium sp. 18060]
MLFDIAERAASDELDFSGLAESEHVHHHADAVTRELSEPVSADALVDLLEAQMPDVARVKGIVDVRIGSASCPYVEPLGTGATARALVAIGYGIDTPASGPGSRPRLRAGRRLQRASGDCGNYSDSAGESWPIGLDDSGSQ